MLKQLIRRIFKSTEISPDDHGPIGHDHPIIALSMVKNEQDIIEPFIRHNIQFLDALIILDNNSVDHTRSIILKCAQELENVVLADDPEFRYHQHDRMTTMLHCCQAAYFADYILFLDADEFISAPTPAEFRQHLQAIPPGGQGYMPWQTFVIPPGHEHTAGLDAPKSFTHRRAVEKMPFYKAVIRLDGEPPTGITVEPGNHDTLRHGQSLPPIVLEHLPLLHVPVRSAAQLAAKSIVGWTALAARNPNARAENTGFQWRQAFDRVTEQGVTGLEQRLSRTSLGYANDTTRGESDADAVPVTTTFAYERRHSDGRSMDTLSVVARSWERSLVPRRPLLELHHPTLDVPPLRFIVEKHNPPRVLDLTPAPSQYIAMCKALGVAETIEPGNLDPKTRSHMVLCLEQAAHLDPTTAQTLLDTAARHAEHTILFSAAEPGQPGPALINRQPLSHWLAEWRRRGWVPNLPDTLGMRALATLSEFRRNLIVLNPGNGAHGRAAEATLLNIAAKPYAWYQQSPGTREFPFADPPFTEAQAYHPNSR